MATRKAEFTEPPTKGRKTVRYNWEAITAQLREHPIEWARIAKQGKESTANAIREGKVSGIHPSNGYEVMAAETKRNAKPRTADIFVRYNPETDTTLTAKERKAAMAAVRRAEKEKQDGTGAE